MSTPSPRKAASAAAIALTLALAACATTAPGDVVVEPSTASAQDSDTAQDAGDAAVAEMMAKAAKYTQPGPQHEFLGLLIGEWGVESRLTMGGAQGAPQAGTAVNRWEVDGRWLTSEWTGSLMGMEGEVHHVIGYDPMKMSYVWTSFSSFDNALNRAEGDRTLDGDGLILWGTLDEYLTGEHDKMVKYHYRFEGERDDAGAWTSIDRYVLEVHDMLLPEGGTMVLEFTYTRK